MADDIAQKIHENLSKFPKRTYPKGQILVFADESPEHIFYIVKGRVRKYDVSYRGEEVIVNIFQNPAFFPMSWAFNRSPNHFFYKTETETELHVVPVDAALNFVKDNPDVMFDLLSRIYRGMDGLLGRVVHLMSGSAKSRLLYELIIECRRFGEKVEEKVEDNSVTLGVNEVDLAARSGLSRETVSREMNKLKTEGLVTVNSKGITVKDLEALEKKIGIEI
ncbi:MAG: Crp/Fnr family transcriptional regulator [Candidatus Saccharimonadales bacterium]